MMVVRLVKGDAAGARPAVGGRRKGRAETRSHRRKGAETSANKA